MIKYNLCFIKQGTKILLLNREFPSWMGCWNGVGGKLEKNEHPRLSVLREIYEETQIDSPNIQFKGLLTWTILEKNECGGLYLYLAELPEEAVYQTPKKTDEGILDWKEISWILHPENFGVAANIPSCIDKMLKDKRCFHHHCIFEAGKMIQQIALVIDSVIEDDEALRTDYLSTYIIEEACGIR
ncbi:DNA mismatch repair protein MutT [Paenibacillus selenitireducens]|uniref:DNA mismatch repair protein MutT n=1 Tax=Paenibacillus selenitireducens TaxID=1324314 RepID=A0A1T2X6P8_9BACL|nr:8-oxo-dGTP diphosphatase [Paenibacillus selenitireducens]OPA75346.1 DNA mismatch repair protein MutT [Paenibacillus selenitireducens]